MKKTPRKWWPQTWQRWDALCAACERGLGFVSQWLGRTFRRAQPKPRSFLLLEWLEPRAMPSGSSLLFQPNDGQFDSKQLFMAQGDNFELFLGAKAKATLVMTGGGDYSAAGVSLVAALRGANADAQAVGLDETDNAAGTPAYGKVEYQNIYPNIDAVFMAPTQSQMQVDFIVHPGGDPGSILQAFHGADAVALDGQGDVIVSTQAGDFMEQAPTLYQTIHGVQQTVTGNYVLTSTGKVELQVGSYDTAKKLIIDPNMNFPPVAMNDSYMVKHDQTLNVAAAGVLANDSDPNGNPITAVLYSNPSHGCPPYRNPCHFSSIKG